MDTQTLTIQSPSLPQNDIELCLEVMASSAQGIIEEIHNGPMVKGHVEGEKPACAIPA
ncbi:hypothetical protein ACE6H2_027410 [Prunus campanulata]